MTPTKTLKALVFVPFFLMLAFGLSAQDSKVEIKSGDTLGNWLKRHQGQKVEIFLGSGQSMKGQIANVTQHMLHLSKLTGKEFFDAVVRIEKIGAVIIRGRTR